MGRMLPTESDPLFLHSALVSLSLHVFFMAAVVAVVASLCGNRGKTCLKTESSNRAAEDGNNVAETSPITYVKTEMAAETEKSQEQQLQDSRPDPPTEEVPLYPLPLPQSLRPLPDGHRVPPFKSASTRHLKVSLSLKMPSKITRIRTTARQNRNNKNADDCIWKKTIILGEKCRVPSAGDEDYHVLDENGNRVVPYTPRTPRSLPVSRTVSMIDPEAVPRRNS